MSPNKLLIMRAVPGAGKTFLARQIAGRLGGKIFSADDMLVSRDGYQWTPELSQAAHHACQQMVRLAMQRGVKVILVDNTNLRPAEARPYVDAARQFGYSVEVREPQTPWRHDVIGLVGRGTHGLSVEKEAVMLQTWIGMPVDEFKRSLGIQPDGSLVVAGHATGN